MRRHSRIALALTAASLAAMASLLGGVTRDAGDASAGRPSSTAAPGDRLAAGFAAGDTDALIGRLQALLRADGRNARAATLLGLAYQQRARETGDPSDYPRAEEALRRAVAISPRNAEAIGGLGSLALARHQFQKALALGRRARTLAPFSVTPHGIVGDAQIELGRYRQAFAAFDRMVSLKPGVAAYSRISYARELLGDTPGAIEAMELAVAAAHPQPEPTAWARVQLGKLYFARGRLDEAGRQYRAALAILPGYVYGLDALAQVEAAEGRLPRAIELQRAAVERIPLPQFAGALGDLYRVAGREREARDQYALVGVIERLLVANGVVTDLELALFNLDHGIRAGQALERARRAHAARPSIEADDVLAWALERNGRCREALRYSERALRLGTLDALKFFHRGMIERCLGRDASARRWFSRALRTNPHFSVIWAPVARGALA
jgi:tetratricopeptide (TPR) repeat protein